MTTAPVRPVSPPGGQLTIRTAPRPRPGMAVGGRPTAQQLTDTACRLVDTHPELLTSVEPLRRLELVARRLAEVTPLGEIDALGTLVDRLPRPADAMDHEVIPLLRHVDQLGPDLNQLLDSVSQLSHMASRLPTVFRRRNHSKP